MEVTIDQAMGIAVEHYRAGRWREAEEACRQILAINSRYSDALNLLGTLAHHAGLNDAALELIGRAIEISPKTPAYHSNLGNVLRIAGRLDEAIAAYETALALNPYLAQVHSNLGSALERQGQLDRAVAACRMAIQLNPNLFEAHSNLGNALSDLGEIDRAIKTYRHALELNPAHPEVHCNLGMCLLLDGDFASGWREYEWRRRCADAHDQGREFSAPLWNGEDLAGRTILLHAEQGQGDTIQFIRYVKLLADRGAKIILECQSELIELLCQIAEVSQWVGLGQPLPHYDLHYPLLSLPLAFGTTPHSIPSCDPFLRAPAHRAAMWPNRLGGGAKLKVGLAWAGNPHHKNDRNRSIPLSQMSPLKKLANVQFVSLQIGANVGDEERSTWAGGMMDQTAELSDFADTAALIEHLDLVISVDTAVAHLAGSMGKPTWLLLPFIPDWRWMLRRSDSPWYPTMRLFRQDRIGDWSAVIDRVTVDLAMLAKK